MKSLITPLFSNFLIDRIKDDLSNSSVCNAYITIGRSKSFTGNDPANVENVIYTTNSKNEFYYSMVGMKKIYESDMQPVISRVDWASGTTYDTYEDHIEIFSYVDYHNLGSANSNANTILSGTVGITTNSNVVVGTSTTFTSYLFPGDTISINNTTKSVVSVTNNTSLVVNSVFSNTNSSQSLTLLSNSQTIVGITANFVGNVGTGNVVIVGEDAREVVSVRSNKVISLNANAAYSNSSVTVQRRDNTYPQVANTFYVRNNRDQIFKCLFNGNNAISTVEPTIDIDGQLPENPFIVTSDGYRWKYMYTIPPGLKQKFFTKQWMPVVTDSAVVAGSKDGRIDIVRVLWGGSGYSAGGNTNTGSFLSVTNTDGSDARLLARVSNGNITSVTVQIGGNNYTRGTITANNILANRLDPATLNGTFNIDGSTYVNANTANASTTRFLGNVFVNDIVTINGVSRNVVSIVNNTILQVNTPFIHAANTQTAYVDRSNAVFDIQIGPSGGHGSNPARELRAHSLMICVELNDDTDGNKIPISDSTTNFKFNQVGLLVNPLIANSAWYANLTNYRATTRLIVSDPTVAEFVNGETVFIGSSLAAANAVANVAHWSAGDNYLYINNITGVFPVAAQVRGANSGITTPILSVSNSEIKPFSGDLIYMENRTNITRVDNQIDQVKIVLSF